MHWKEYVKSQKNKRKSSMLQNETSWQNKNEKQALKNGSRAGTISAGGGRRYKAPKNKSSKNQQPNKGTTRPKKPDGKQRTAKQIIQKIMKKSGVSRSFWRKMHTENPSKTVEKSIFSLDVKEKTWKWITPEVEMVMQQILLHDDVAGNFDGWKQNGRVEIEVSTNRPYLPRQPQQHTGRRIWWSANTEETARNGKIRIDIKEDSMAAGLAGGQQQQAAVLHALNQLWSLV